MLSSSDYLLITMFSITIVKSGFVKHLKEIPMTIKTETHSTSHKHLFFNVFHFRQD